MLLRKILLFMVLIMFTQTTVLFSQETQLQQEIQKAQQRVVKINDFLKDYKFVSYSTRGLIKSAILLCPEPYRDFAISQFREIIDQKLSNRGETVKYVPKDMVVEALGEMMPADVFPSAKEALGVTRNGRVPFQWNSFHGSFVEKNDIPKVQNNK